ncbi:hypothetical protein NEOLEDRAFT_1083247 [Neolentinus lepideus HHB14362 ss-1]|uniref:RFX-type winged-helix domain-containing protein n=1 Tax=Neolentinus lepideus HHB14362 ss-1 TaxID=1314782 RepID=A0A165W8B1_9AGAM|nr:hypothetical protein NEOLEDRAFT_1083247 [Neolentinus lepideus HHB14362 ss-1]
MYVNAARTNTYTPTYTRLGPNITDDYERWYTEATPNNRMLLSLRSGLDSEISWALDRLCRLCNNDQFLLKSIPGLTNTLFEFPEWYVAQCEGEKTKYECLFSSPPETLRRRRHGLEALFILRNSVVNEPNAAELASYPKTLPLLSRTLHKVRPNNDSNTEFLLNAIEILQTIASSVVFPSTPTSVSNPIPTLERIANSSTNRSLIIASMTALNDLLSNPKNASHLSPESPALEAAIRYLPLLVDRPLVDACLNYLYSHLSHYAMAKAFLLHRDMSSTLKVLVSLLLHEQIEETVSLDISQPVATVPEVTVTQRDHELTPEELDKLVSQPEPHRCYEWMRTMFVAKPEGELTQVEFWNLYKDVFQRYQDQYPLLVASDVIKNVNLVFPSAQAMVLPGPPQKFVVRGVDRRKDSTADERFKCHWDRDQCPAPPFDSTSGLYEHILTQHIQKIESSDVPCLWATCSNPPVPKSRIPSHVLTHLPSPQPPKKHPSQPSEITLPSPDYPHPAADPTTRPPPPLRKAAVTYQRATVDAPSTSLTALLCLRILFRTSFASAAAAPKVDADHFGFPGVVEEIEEEDEADTAIQADESEREAEMRGRKAFIRVRKMMENVRLRDETLMGWIVEMVDAGMSGS